MRHRAAPGLSSPPGRCSCRRQSSRRTAFSEGSWDLWRLRPTPARAGSVALAQQRERTRPAHLIGGDGVVLDPVAAGVLIEVRARIGGLVDGRKIEALDDLRWRGFGVVRLRGGGNSRQPELQRPESGGKQGEAISFGVLLNGGQLRLIGGWRASQDRI
jgi:hypothetical protein